MACRTASTDGFGDDGSVYFAVERFAAYGRLSRLDRRELKPAATA